MSPEPMDTSEPPASPSPEAQRSTPHRTSSTMTSYHTTTEDTMDTSDGDTCPKNGPHASINTAIASTSTNPSSSNADSSGSTTPTNTPATNAPKPALTPTAQAKTALPLITTTTASKSNNQPPGPTTTTTPGSRPYIPHFLSADEARHSLHRAAARWRPPHPDATIPLTPTSELTHVRAAAHYIEQSLARAPDLAAGRRPSAQRVEARAWLLLDAAKRLHDVGCLVPEAEDYSGNGGVDDRRLAFGERWIEVCRLVKKWDRAAQVAVEGEERMLDVFAAAPRGVAGRVEAEERKREEQFMIRAQQAQVLRRQQGRGRLAAASSSSSSSSSQLAQQQQQQQAHRFRQIAAAPLRLAPPGPGLQGMARDGQVQQSQQVQQVPGQQQSKHAGQAQQQG